MDILSVSGLINGIGALSFGLLIFHKNWRDNVNRVFFLLMTSVAFWSLIYWYWLSTNHIKEEALFLVRMLSIGSLFIPVFYFHWIILVINKPHPRLLKVIYTIAIIFLTFSFSDFFIKNVKPKLVYQFWPDATPMYNLYLALVYLGLVIYALWLLFGDYKIPEKRGLTFYLILGSVLGFGGGLTNFFLWYDIPIKPYGNFLVVFFSLCFGYAMMKYHLFNVKAFASELLTFTIWILLLIRVLQAQTINGLVVDTGILVFSIIAGIFLVRSVYREVEQREQLEILTRQLASANEQLKKLDTAKSEFISIASHQLRAPMTVIKGYVSLILEGSIGKIEASTRDALNKVSIATEHLVKLISDLLDLSRIESGKIRYEFAPNDFVKVVEEVTREFKDVASKRGVGFDFQNTVGSTLNLSFDKDKVHEVVLNLIDNAVKYSKSGGKVLAKLEKSPEAGWVRFSVKDDGLGISKDDIKKLFTKFVRSDEARLVDPGGMGIGLYFVKKVMDDHKGRIGVESEGVGKGSIFWAELPLK